MTERDFRKLALALEGVAEGAHMGHADFRAHGRIFASLRGEPVAFGALMLTSEQQQDFIARSDAFTPESGAWGRSGWTRVQLTAVDGETLGEALTLAWQNAAAKAASASSRRSARKKVTTR
jgi:hypothetical protein